MKNINKNKIVKVSNTNNLLRKTFERAKMIAVKNNKMFLTFIGKLSWRVILLATQTNLEGTRNRVNMIHNFSRYLISLEKKHGANYVIAYLKASQLALSKYIAGERVNSLAELNPDYIFPRLASGLPKIIGPHDRIALRHNNRKTIILWMSIFGLFRILNGNYKLKLNTISDPFSGSFSFLAEKSISMPGTTRDALGALPLRKDGLRTLYTDRLLLFQTSSPSSKVSWKGALIDVQALVKQGLHVPIKEWLEIIRSPLLEHFENIQNRLCPDFLNLIPTQEVRVAYVKAPPLGDRMLHLLRLCAISGSSDQKAEELIIPVDKLFKRVYTEGELKPSKSDLCYPTENSFREFDPWVIKREWNEIVDGLYPVPRSYVSPSHEVAFITHASTPNEIKAATILSDPYPSLFKNEDAIDQIGQVQFVKEPAGKLRVFAMVDVWTQSIMQPVHRMLTNILKVIPNDGTLNQNLSYERARQKSLLYGKSYGYDLSAATDRLPISLQVSVLRGVMENAGINRNFAIYLAGLWKEILVTRSFRIPKLPKGVEDPQGLQGTSIYYEVGQPMGALSSFNMLALTHHMILQDIAQSLGRKGWCELYEITGDDISIFDSQIAAYYVDYMASLGLEINQKKSVVALHKAAGEYLKKTWIRDIDVSMISWKQLYQNHSTLMGRVSDALYFLQKWNTHKLSVPKVVRRACLTWPDLKKNDRHSLSIPYLALLSTALRQSKLPMEKFFLFLMGQKDRFLEFKSLYSKLSSLKLNQEEIQFFLKAFFERKELTFPTNKDWQKREIAFSAPLLGLRKSVIDQIVRLQFKLHGGEIDSSQFPKQKPMKDIFAPGTSMTKDFDFKFARTQDIKPFSLLSSDWSKEQIAKIVLEFSGAHIAAIPRPPSKPGGVSYDKLWIIEGLVIRGMIIPALTQYSLRVCKMFPKINRAVPYVPESLLQDKTLSELMELMDALTNLETMLMTHKIQDLDRKVSHKTSLSILSKIKPAKTVHEENFSFSGLGFGSGLGLGSKFDLKF